MPKNDSLKHEPVEMKFVDTLPRKSRPTKHFRNGKNIWFSVYRCDVCGDLLKRLANLHIKSIPVCDGVKYADKNALRRS